MTVIIASWVNKFIHRENRFRWRSEGHCLRPTELCKNRRHDRAGLGIDKSSPSIRIFILEENSRVYVEWDGALRVQWKQRQGWAAQTPRIISRRIQVLFKEIRVSLEGQDFGQQKEEKINPKKKELEKVLPNLNTDINKVACFISKFNFKR